MTEQDVSPIKQRMRMKSGDMVRSHAMTIGQLSRRSGVPIKVLRDYEDLGFLSHGDCEIVAFPSLLFRRHYTVYCPLNAIDLVERRCTKR